MFPLRGLQDNSYLKCLRLNPQTCFYSSPHYLGKWHLNLPSGSDEKSWGPLSLLGKAQVQSIKKSFGSILYLCCHYGPRIDPVSSCVSWQPRVTLITSIAHSFLEENKAAGECSLLAGVPLSASCCSGSEAFGKCAMRNPSSKPRYAGGTLDLRQRMSPMMVVTVYSVPRPLSTFSGLSQFIHEQKSSDLPQVTQLVTGRGGTWTRDIPISEPRYFLHVLHHSPDIWESSLSERTAKNEHWDIIDHLFFDVF